MPHATSNFQLNQWQENFATFMAKCGAAVPQLCSCMCVSLCMSVCVCVGAAAAAAAVCVLLSADAAVSLFYIVFAVFAF